MKYFLCIAVLLTSCAQATPEPTQIIFITPTKGTAIKTTDEPLPFRNLVTPSLTPTKRPPTNTPAPVIATSRVIVPVISPKPFGSPRPEGFTDVASAESNVIILINTHRSSQGMPPLARSEAVMQIARARSADMARIFFAQRSDYGSEFRQGARVGGGFRQRRRKYILERAVVARRIS
ncbi:MAG: hypothetical protein HZC38_02580 [Chloroflexi bacterium]|nr:hypothetical protein [Chloroflexota bacterium]